MDAGDHQPPDHPDRACAQLVGPRRRAGLTGPFGRLSKSELVSGIPGSRTDHFGVPYALTEEFVAVYRMHPLIPDDYAFRAASERTRSLEERQLPRDRRAGTPPELFDQISLTDLLYSFGTAHPGAITLHNFPRFLQEFERPDGMLQDLAAIDILRIRELGVPRYNEFRQLLHISRPCARSRS